MENPTTPTIEYPLGTSAVTSISFVTLGFIAVFGPSLFWVLMAWDRENQTSILRQLEKLPEVVFQQLYISPVMARPKTIG